MRHLKSAVATLVLSTVALGMFVLLGHMALDAFEYEQRRIESQLNELNEFVTQPPPAWKDN